MDEYITPWTKGNPCKLTKHNNNSLLCWDEKQKAVRSEKKAIKIEYVLKVWTNLLLFLVMKTADKHKTERGWVDYNQYRHGNLSRVDHINVPTPFPFYTHSRVRSWELVFPLQKIFQSRYMCMQDYVWPHYLKTIWTFDKILNLINEKWMQNK